MAREHAGTQHRARLRRQQGVPVPTWRTVKARLLLIDERIRASRRGEEGLLRARIATPGQYQVTRPHEVVQIDHTQVDVMVLDEASREVVGPPWITLAIDGHCQLNPVRNGFAQFSI